MEWRTAAGIERYKVGVDGIFVKGLTQRKIFRNSATVELNFDC